ncbi:MAG: lipoprotein [Verrucomicrobiales bacterium]|nr:lipoprotein [Verrucomicrobiales bacterium]
MKRLLTILAAVVLVHSPVSAAVLYYNLTATGDQGTTGTGSFSFDDGVIDADYSDPSASGDFLSFNVTLQVANGAPSTTVFDLTTVGPELFVMVRSGGVISDFNPGGSNDDGYSLSPFSQNSALLSGNSVNETISWSYSPVPEPETYAAWVGAGLACFAVVRRIRTKSNSVKAP